MNLGVRVVPLGSGSRGNATFVEIGQHRILVDAGLSARDLGRRLERIGVEPTSIDWILLSHEHHDHSRGAERFSMRHGVAVAATPGTLEAMNLAPMHVTRFRPLERGAVVDLDGLAVDAFPVPHDARDPVGFVLESNGVRAGVLTDAGHATTLIRERLRRCDVLVVESNYDAAMLRDGPYPWQLKQRVAGRTGHLANHDTAALLRAVAHDGLQAVILVHLSETNNTPALARAAAGDALASCGLGRVQMRVATQKRPAVPVEVRAAGAPRTLFDLAPRARTEERSP